MLDQKLSILINRQLPEFVRDEYPRFISFLEAYYEFLDRDLNLKGKKLKTISDVDKSIDDFEQQFFNTFIPFIPRNTATNKEFIIKNILPLYLSKGSEKSYKLLFRMLFNEEVQLSFPGQNILRASDGKWSVQNLLRVTTDVYTEYVSDGIQTEYSLPYVLNLQNFNVFIDDNFTTDYLLQRENKKIIFTVAPSEDSIIKIEYKNFDPKFLENRQIVGETSKATAIVEKISKKSISNLLYFEFFVNTINLVGLFINGEKLNTNFIVDDVSIPFTLQTFSDLEKIEIVDGGSSYNVGDPVIIRGTAVKDAIAIVNEIASGVIEELNIINGGSGFQINNSVQAVGFSTNSFTTTVQTVDSTGVNSSNTITYNTDVIENYLDIPLDAEDYEFPAEIELVEDIDTVIANALSSNTITDLGSITSFNIQFSSISSISNPTFDVIPSTIINDITIRDLGIIGKINIISGGQNYEIGEKLIFTNSPYSFSGQGAEAEIADVNDNGSITQIKITNGGLSYNKNLLPSVSVESSNGVGAILSINSIMGNGEILQAVLEDSVAGQILSIRVLDSGISYANVPGIDLTQSGDGNATAVATIRDTFLSLPGKWKTSQGLISNDDIRLQGRDYYIDYSYVLSSQVEFSKYKEILKLLLHPAGFVKYSKYIINENIELNVDLNVESEIIKTASGFVSISNGSSIIVGSNTLFESLNTNNVMIVGTNISISGEERIVSDIIDDTTIEVTDSFESNSTNSILKILE